MIIPIAGVLLGLVCLFLAFMGNPANMSLCVACFARDISGSLALHSVEGLQYLRPEIPGIILGAFIVSMLFKEHSPRGGSAPVTRFVLGFAVMIGAMVFLGCPTRMLLRLAGGDFNALVGFAGFIFGVGTGVLFLNRGFTLERNYSQPKTEGFVFPFINFGLLFLLIVAPSLLLFSHTGAGSFHAPIWASLTAGLIAGVIAQKTRLCFISGIRDAILFKQFHGLAVFAALLLTVFIGNLIMGNFNPGFANQPIAHTDALWNILGLYLVGFASVLLGGCPFRQLILAGSGNSDSAVTVLGFLAGGAFVHNFRTASSPAGVTTNGMVAVGISIIVVLIIAFTNTKRFGND